MPADCQNCSPDCPQTASRLPPAGLSMQGMHKEQALTEDRRIGLDLFVLLALAVLAGVASAVTLAALAMLIAGATATATPTAPAAPLHAPAARTMLASSPAAR